MSGPDTDFLPLPRARKIKQGRDFARAKSRGERLAKGCLAVNWYVLPEDAPSRVGVITGKRMGKAVQRNRARRLMREAFRLHQHHLKRPLDLILIARQSIAGKMLRDVERDYLAILRQGGLLKKPH